MILITAVYLFSFVFDIVFYFIFILLQGLLSGEINKILSFEDEFMHLLQKIRCMYFHIKTKLIMPAKKIYSSCNYFEPIYIQIVHIFRVVK